MSRDTSALLAQDDDARRDALSLDHSFLIQAPAGSGKTGLLVQRLLGLLSRVDRPEAILAITFTKKAAQEMRHRVLAALKAATATRAVDAPPLSQHEHTTLALARAVLVRDEALDWQLLKQPERLPILTIDAFNQRLVRRLPLGSGLGALPNATEQAESLHAAAADWVLDELANTGAENAPVMQVLAWLDNDPERLKQLLINMLAGRERWQRQVLDPSDTDRAALESALTAEVLGSLGQLTRHWPKALQQEVLDMLAVALANLREAALNDELKPDQLAILGLQHADHFPGVAVSELPRWQALATLCLTQTGTVRKQVNKNQGFPPGTTASEKSAAKAAKERAEACLRALADLPDLVAGLEGVWHLPSPSYTEAEWAMIQSLLAVLRLAMAALRVVMAEASQVDFPEVASAALAALGPEEAPTDLGLALDSRIQHVLVDEFQDTSLSQFNLLTRLVAGWTPGDGRSLFLVGDPMQSIYRFREADVGLFLQVAERRQIGALALEYRQLTRNFRSTPGVVDWVNGVFSHLLPEQSDLISGRIAHAASAAARSAPADPLDAVRVHLLASADEATAKVVNLVSQYRADHPAASIAVLGPTRTQIAPVLAALRQAGLAPVAVDLDSIGKRPVVLDLLALTRALDHPADRLAWLAVLRAPYAGLDLATLTFLTEGDSTTPLPLLAQDAARRERMSSEMRERLDRVMAALIAPHPARVHPSALSERVRSVWYTLGGPACLSGEDNDAIAEAYFTALATHAPRGGNAAVAALEAALARAKVPAPPTTDQRLQVLTMHKAKGLEFDCVVLIGLTGKGQRANRPLLYNLTRPRADGRVDLLLCPIPPSRGAGVGDTARYDYVHRLMKAGDAEESVRLLYVATTRARDALHIVANPRVDADGKVKVAAGTLLATLWPGLDVREQALAATAATAAPEISPADAARVVGLPPIRPVPRLPADWAWPTLDETVPSATSGASARDPDEEPTRPEFDWAGQGARAVGSVVHSALQAIAEDGLDRWDAARIEALRGHWAAALRSFGVAQAELAERQAEVATALCRTLADPQGRWCLSAHPAARSEWALGRQRQGQPQIGIIDRYFETDGLAWIIDFKTSSHAGRDRDAFLDNERTRYQTQLETYAELVRPLTRLPIQLGLYFPLLGGWRTWPAPPPADS